MSIEEIKNTSTNDLIDILTKSMKTIDGSHRRYYEEQEIIKELKSRK